MLGKDACTEDIYTALHANGCRDLHPRAAAEPQGLVLTGPGMGEHRVTNAQ